MITLLSDRGRFEVDDRRVDARTLEDVTGWQLKPEGACRGDVCVPLPSGAGPVDVVDLWSRLGQPAVSTDDESVWFLGEGAEGRRLDSLVAPDFTLPDMEGKLHSLSDHRGKKVFLATWASW